MFRASIIVATIEIPLDGEFASIPAAQGAARRKARQVINREHVQAPLVRTRVFATDGTYDGGEEVKVPVGSIR